MGLLPRLLLLLLLPAAAQGEASETPDTVPKTTITPLDIAAAVKLPGWFLAAVEAEAHGREWAANENQTAPCAAVVGFINSTACADGRTPVRARACRRAHWAAAEAIAHAGVRAHASLKGALFGLIDVAQDGGGGATDGRALAAALQWQLLQSSEVALWLFTTDRRYSSGGHKKGYEGVCRPSDQAAEESAEKAASAGWWAAADSAADRLFSRLLMHGAPFELPTPFTGPQLRDAMQVFCGGQVSDAQLATQRLQQQLGLPKFSDEDARVLIDRGAELTPWTPQRSQTTAAKAILDRNTRRLTHYYRLGLLVTPHHLLLAINTGSADVVLAVLAKGKEAGGVNVNSKIGPDKLSVPLVYAASLWSRSRGVSFLRGSDHSTVLITGFFAFHCCRCRIHKRTPWSTPYSAWVRTQASRIPTA